MNGEVAQHEAALLKIGISAHSLLSMSEDCSIMLMGWAASYIPEGAADGGGFASGPGGPQVQAGSRSFRGSLGGFFSRPGCVRRVFSRGPRLPVGSVFVPYETSSRPPRRGEGWCGGS